MVELAWWGEQGPQQKKTTDGGVSDADISAARKIDNRSSSDKELDGVQDSMSAQDARDTAAKRTRNTRSMPNAFPVGGEPKE